MSNERRVRFDDIHSKVRPFKTCTAKRLYVTKKEIQTNFGYLSEISINVLNGFCWQLIQFVPLNYVKLNNFNTFFSSLVKSHVSCHQINDVSIARLANHYTNGAPLACMQYTTRYIMIYCN